FLYLPPYRAFYFDHINRKCHLLPFDRFSEGAKRERKPNYDLYEKKVECMKCNGETYRGPMDHTESGKECQRWDSQKPHKHTYQPNRHVGKGLDDNYCRNPNNDVRPWCYTMDKNTPWEYCNISVCDSDNDVEVEVTTSCFQGQGEGYRGTVNVTPAECYEDNGESYRGNLSKTRSGIPCGLWSDHTFRYMFP
ncbi:hypothetical protein cypCar_00009010, partial [Cyprinus carpio]